VGASAGWVGELSVPVWRWWGMWGDTLWMWGTIALGVGGWGAVAGVFGVAYGSSSSFLGIELSHLALESRLAAGWAREVVLLSRHVEGAEGWD
jgi:hypothetical protein